MALAQAIYDNVADTAEELSFKQGDLVLILEREPLGLEGWWLCGLADGQQGIAPANRLKELPGDLKSSFSKPLTTLDNQQAHTKMGRVSEDSVYDIPKSSPAGPKQSMKPAHLEALDSLYDYPPTQFRDNLTKSESDRSSGISTMSTGSLYTSSSNSVMSSGQNSPELAADLYDTPMPSSRFTPKPAVTEKAPQLKLVHQSVVQNDSDTYDVPKPFMAEYGDDYCDIDAPTPTTTSTSPFAFQKQAAPIAKVKPNMVTQENIYDSPPQVAKDLHGPYAKQVIAQDSSVKRSSSSLISAFSQDKSLPKESAKVLELAHKKNDYLQRCCSKLLEYATPKWQVRANLEQKLFDIKMASVALRDAFVEVVEFDIKVHEHWLSTCKDGHVTAFGRTLAELKSSLEVLQGDLEALAALEWDVEKLTAKNTKSLVHVQDLFELGETVSVECKKAVEILDRYPEDCGAKTKNYSRKSFPILKTSLAEAQPEGSRRDSSPVWVKRDDIGVSPPSTASPKTVTTTTAVKTLTTTTTTPAVTTEVTQSSSSVKSVAQSFDKKETPPRPPPPRPPKPMGKVGSTTGQVEVKVKSEETKVTPVHHMNRPLPDLPTKTGPHPEKKAHETFLDYDVPVPQTSEDAITTPKKTTHPQPVEDEQGIDYDYIDLTPTPSEVRTTTHPLCDASKTDDSPIYDSPPNSYQDYDIPPPVAPLSSSKSVEMLKASDDTYDSPVSGSGRSILQQTRDFQSLSDLRQSFQTSLDSNRSSLSSQSSGSRPNSLLTPVEKELLLFYNVQLHSQSLVLLHAIEALYGVLEQHEPPQVFTGHSKFVIVAAHKVAYIGDAVARQIKVDDLKNQVISDSNRLCEALKALVYKTKQAALNFPAEDLSKDMMTCARQVAIIANQLQETFAASLSLA